jgi:hypothetical protein
MSAARVGGLLSASEGFSIAPRNFSIDSDNRCSVCPNPGETPVSFPTDSTIAATPYRIAANPPRLSMIATAWASIGNRLDIVSSGPDGIRAAP